MKLIAVICLCFIAVMGAPAEEKPKREQPAVEQIDNRDELGQYTLKYVTAEGTIVIERGQFVPTADGTDKVLVYEGEYTFIGDDGKIYITKYKTDISGAYQPEGDHLPKPVVAEPVPEVDAMLESTSKPVPEVAAISESSTKPALVV